MGDYCSIALSKIGGCTQGHLSKTVSDSAGKIKIEHLFNPEEIKVISYLWMNPITLTGIREKGSQYYIDQIKSNKYPITNENLKSNLIKLSLSKGVVPSIYFGIYYLDKETQKRYMKKDKDNTFELRFDELDREGWLNLIESSEYKSIMRKSDKETWRKAYELLKGNKTVNTMEKPIKNVNVTETFASNWSIITEPGGLPITLRSATMKSNTKMEAKQTKAGFEIYILKQYKLYDEFKEPYNIKVIDGYIKIYTLTKKETGTPYRMSSGYRDQYIIKKTFPNRQEALKYLEQQSK